MQEAATGAFPEPMRIFAGSGNGAPSPEYAAFRAQQGSGAGGGSGEGAGGGNGAMTLLGDIGGIFSSLEGASGVLGGIMTAVAAGLGPIGILLAVLEPGIEALATTLMPALNATFQPLLGFIITLGAGLGKILVPIVQALAPVIELLTQLFVWIYNLALVPFGNLIIFIGNMLFNLGQFIKNLIAMDFAHLDKGTRPATYGFLQPITLDTVTAAGEAATSGNTYSSNVTVQKPADVYIYFTIQGNVIGAASKEELGAWLVDCIQKALGTGVRPEFLQGAA